MKRVVVFLAVVSVVAAAGLLAADSYRAKLLGQIVNVQADTSYTVERGANLRRVLDNLASDGWIEEPFGLIERCALRDAAKYEPVLIELSQVRRFFR